MFFKSKMNKLCDNVPVVLSGNNIDFVHETKYLGAIINSSMKTSSGVVRQTRKFYAQTNMLLRNFRYYTKDVKRTLFMSFCANMYCCPLWSTSSTIKKLKTSYNSDLRNLLLIKKPYSASTMYVAHGIPSFHELLCTSIYRFADRVCKNLNSIILSLSHSAMVEISVMLISINLLCDIFLLFLLLSLLLLFLYMITIFVYVYGPCVCNKDILLLLLLLLLL